MECLSSDPRIIDCILERDRYGLSEASDAPAPPLSRPEKRELTGKMCFVVSLRSVQY